MSWQRQFDGAAERLAARHADKVNQAMIAGIDLPKIVREWIASQPSTNTTRQQAAVWVHHHVIPDTKPLEQALRNIYRDGYALGKAFAATAYARTKLSIKKAAPTGDELRAAYETDWNEWQPGSEAQAAFTEASGALQQRFNEAAISEKTKIWSNSMDRLGIVMADTARAGLGVATTTQAILEAQIGWGFSDALTDPYKAMRIARTEINRAQSLATVETYKEYGLEKIEWLASEGECEICSDNMDVGPVEIGYEFDSINEAITEPPAHPNCLCTLMPALDDTLAEEQPQVDQSEEEAALEEEAASDVEAADLSPVDVELPEAEQPDVSGSVIDHEPATAPTNERPSLAEILRDRQSVEDAELQMRLAQYSMPKEMQGSQWTLNALQEKLGIGGAPELVEDASQLQGEVIYRGITEEKERTDTDGWTWTKTSDRIGAFKRNERAWIGRGMYSDGDYFSNIRDTAVRYSNDQDIVTAAFKTDARILEASSTRELEQLGQQAWDEIRAELAIQISKELGRAVEDINPDYINEAMSKLGLGSRYGLTNNGAIFMVKGYDAIRVFPDMNTGNQAERYVIVLNRAALQVVK